MVENTPRIQTNNCEKFQSGLSNRRNQRTDRQTDRQPVYRVTLYEDLQKTISCCSAGLIKIITYTNNNSLTRTKTINFPRMGKFKNSRLIADIIIISVQIVITLAPIKSL